MESSHDNGEKMLLAVPEAAQRMSISSRKLFLMIAAGEIGHVRCGKRVLIPMAALTKWIADHTYAA